MSRYSFLFRIVLLAILSLIGVRISFAQELEVDAVYLLDVTGSMVGTCREGPCPENAENLKEAINVLIAEIKSFQKGTFILITFADGPHDFDDLDSDGGPIRSTYRVNVRDKNDPSKDTLLQFFKPDEYGPFSDPETGEVVEDWPGVYEAVMSSVNRGKDRYDEGPYYHGRYTAIYDSLLSALAILDGIRERANENYLDTHQQWIVLLTDGRDTASKTSHDEVGRILQSREAEIENKLLVTRYQWGNVHSIPIRNVIEKPVTGRMEEFYRINLDRAILHFNGNLWLSNSVTLEDLQFLRISNTLVPGRAVRIDWGEISIEPKDFKLPAGLALPGDVAIHTSPSPLVPVPCLREGYQFALALEFTPHSRLREHIAASGKLDGVIEGDVYFKFVPWSSEGRYVDFAQYRLRAELPFERPNLELKVSKEQEAFCLRFEGNKAFDEWLQQEDQEHLSFEYNKDHFRLTDEFGDQLDNRVDASELVTARRLYLKVRPDLSCGHYEGWIIRVLPPKGNGGVLINGGPAFELRYELAAVGCDRDILSFPNLWVPPFQIADDARSVNLPTIGLFGLPEDWNWEYFSITPEGFDLPVGIQPELRNLREGQFDLTLTVTPYSQLEQVKEHLNANLVDGYLRLKYDDPTNEHLIIFKKAQLPVNLEYKEKVITIVVDRYPTRPLRADEVAFAFSFSYNKDLSVDESGVRIQWEASNPEDPPHFYDINTGRKIGTEPFIFSEEMLELAVSSELKRDAYKGALTFSVVADGVWLEGLEPSMVTSHGMAYTLEVRPPSYVIEIGNEQFTFSNPWVVDIESDIRTVLSNEPLWFVDQTNVPVSGKILIRPTGFSLPEGLLRVNPSEVEPPFTGEKFRLMLNITDFSVLRDQEKSDKVIGSLELSFSGNENVEFNCCGTSSRTVQIPVTIDFRIPDIKVEVSDSSGLDLDSDLQFGTLHRGDHALTLLFNYGELLPSDQSKVSVRWEEEDLEAEGEACDDNYVCDCTELVLNVPLDVSYGHHGGALRVKSAVNPHVTVNDLTELVIEYTYDIPYPSVSSRIIPKAKPNDKGIYDYGVIDPGTLLATFFFEGNREFNALYLEDREVTINTDGEFSAAFIINDKQTGYRLGQPIDVDKSTTLELRVHGDRAKAAGIHEGTFTISFDNSNIQIEGEAAYSYWLKVWPGWLVVLLAIVTGIMFTSFGTLGLGFVGLIAFSVYEKNPPHIVLRDLLRRSRVSWLRGLPVLLLGIGLIFLIARFVLVAVG